MAKPAMRQFCWCCGDLRIGTMAIMTIQSVLAVLILISASITLSNGNYTTDEAASIIQQSNGEFDLKNYTETKSSLIIQISFALFAFAFNGCAYYGADKRFHSYILPWVVYNGVIMSVNVIVVILMAVFLSIAFGASIGCVVSIVCGLGLGKSFSIYSINPVNYAYLSFDDGAFEKFYLRNVQIYHVFPSIIKHRLIKYHHAQNQHHKTVSFQNEAVLKGHTILWGSWYRFGFSL